MGGPLTTVDFSAPLSAVAGSIAVGDCLVEDAFGLYVLSTVAARGTRRSSGIAVSAWGAATQGAVSMQSVGVLAPSVSGLSAGAAGWVRVGAIGRLERAAVVGPTDDLIGWCETDGTVHCCFGLLNQTAPFVALPGSDSQLLFNDGGVVGAASGISYNKSSGVVSVAGALDCSAFATSTGLLSASVPVRVPSSQAYQFANGANILSLKGTPTTSRTLTFPDATATLLHDGQLGAASGIATLDASQKLVQAVPNRIVSVNTVALTANVATTSTAMVDVTGLSVTIANCQVGDLLVFDASVGYTTSVNAGAQYEVVGVDGGSTVQNGSYRSFFAGSGTAYNSAMSGVHVVATAGSVTIKVRHSISTTGTLTTNGSSSAAATKSSLRVIQIRP